MFSTLDPGLYFWYAQFWYAPHSQNDNSCYCILKTEHTLLAKIKSPFRGGEVF